MENFISVIIPTYNRSNELKKCIYSLLSQTNTCFEIIVIDDCSTDNTSEMVSEFFNLNNFKYIKLDKNFGGPAKPRNVGVKNSIGNYVSFCDSDDYWYKDKIELTYQQISNGYEFIYHNFKGISNQETKPTLKNLLEKGNFIINSTVTVHKKLLKEVSYIDENINIQSSEDYDLWIKILALKPKVKKIDIELGAYSISSDRISDNYKLRIRNYFYLLVKHKKKIIKNPLSILKFINSILKNIYFEIKNYN